MSACAYMCACICACVPVSACVRMKAREGDWLQAVVWSLPGTGRAEGGSGGAPGTRDSVSRGSSGVQVGGDLSGRRAEPGQRFMGWGGPLQVAPAPHLFIGVPISSFCNFSDDLG